MSTIDKFNFICLQCEKNNRKSQVNLHVDFKQKKYAVICLNPECNNVEIFDEFGEHTKFDDIKNVKKDKIVN